MGLTGKTRLSFDLATLTDTGKVRINNEDCLLALDKRGPSDQEFESYGIYLVADGMGGHQAGEVASSMAANTISAALLQNVKDGIISQFPSRQIQQAMNKANREIYSMASRYAELYSMGTTVTLGLRLDNELYLGHVGDSRAYLIRYGRIRQLTQDHSLVAQLVRENVITPEQARSHPDRGKILRCLGMPGNMPVDTLCLTIFSGDTLVFCSDGLTGNVTDEEILQHVLKTDSSKQACTELVDIANTRGGEDNTSIIIVKSNSGSGR